MPPFKYIILVAEAAHSFFADLLGSSKPTALTFRSFDLGVCSMETPSKYNRRHAAEYFDWHPWTDRGYGHATWLYALWTRNKRLYFGASQMANCMESWTSYRCVGNFYWRICLDSFLGRHPIKASRVQFRIFGPRNVVLRRRARTAYAVEMVYSLSDHAAKSGKTSGYGIHLPNGSWSKRKWPLTPSSSSIRMPIGYWSSQNHTVHHETIAKLCNWPIYTAIAFWHNILGVSGWAWSAKLHSF